MSRWRWFWLVAVVLMATTFLPLDRWFSMSERSGTENRQRQHQVGVRLSADEWTLAEQLAAGRSVTVADLLRSAVRSDEQVAATLYRMNGAAWYGRDLGSWDDPTSTIGRDQVERERWLAQARTLTRSLPSEDQFDPTAPPWSPDGRPIYDGESGDTNGT